MDISNNFSGIIDNLLNYYSKTLNVAVNCKTPKEKAIAIIYCNSVYIKRERLLHWFDPDYIYKDKITDTSENIRSRTRLRFAFKDYPGWRHPLNNSDTEMTIKRNSIWDL